MIPERGNKWREPPDCSTFPPRGNSRQYRKRRSSRKIQESLCWEDRDQSSRSARIFKAMSWRGRSYTEEEIKTNKQEKSSQRSLWIFGWIQIYSGTGWSGAQAVRGATVTVKTLRRKCELNPSQRSHKAANWSDFPPARMERSHWTWGII